MKVVVDGDQMIYACGFASEGEPHSHTFKLLKNAMNQILADCGTEEYELYIGGKGNFREDIDFAYKANRTARKPESYEACREYLINNWGANVCDGMETDDVVSMKLWEDYVSTGGENIILSSPDKDLNNTPGWHYNPRSREKRFISPQQADRHFWMQMLWGDRVDNIPGLPVTPHKIIEEYGLSKHARRGCGEGTAKKLMKAEPTNYINMVYRCYVLYCLEEGWDKDAGFEYLEQQGQLLHMLREVDEFGEPKMWQAHGALWDDIWETESEAEVWGSDSDAPGQDEVPEKTQA